MLTTIELWILRNMQILINKTYNAIMHKQDYHAEYHPYS
jgi:hypothetical protein